MVTPDVVLDADAQRIEKLVEQIERGRVRLPDFQRRLKWRHSDVRMLFESIYKGFPIGTLLLWRREAAPNPALRIGPVTIEAPRAERGLWVVDGQQRLTSIVGVLRHPGPSNDGTDMFNLWFDLEKLDFFHPNRTRSTSLAIPLARVLDASEYQGWLFDFVGKTGRRDLLPIAHHLGTQIRDYRVPLYTVDTDDEAIARDIFVRINRSGRRMEMHEVFAAMAAPGTDRSARPEEIAERLARDFGPIPSNNVFKAATALTSNAVTHAPKAPSADEDRQAWMADTEDALRAAYAFLRTEVFHTRLLPARVTPVITLARLFHRFPDPLVRNRRLLRRWLWRGFFSGTLESDARTLRRAVTAVGTDEDEAVQALLNGVDVSMRPLTDRVDSRNSWTRLAYLVLAHQRPTWIDPTGDLDTDLFEWLERHAASTFVQWPGAPNVPWARFLVPGISRGDLKSTLVRWCISPLDHESVLRTHLVSPGAASALSDGDTDRFLAERRQALEKAAGLLHSARAEPNAEDRPALRVI